MHVKITCLAFVFCSVMFLFNSCIYKNRTKVTEEREVILSLDEMLLYPMCLNDTTFKHKYKYKYVVYVDSTECSPCKIIHLGIWNYYRNELYKNNTGFYMIFYPPKNMVQDVLKAHTSYKHRIPIYIDTLGVFERDNPHIAEMTTEHHNFLLDENNKIIAFGDASTNYHVRDYIFSILKENADSTQMSK